MNEVKCKHDNVERDALLTYEQIQRELSYRVGLSILREMRKNGLVTAKEFAKMKPKLEEEFSPVWGHLSQSIT